MNKEREVPVRIIVRRKKVHGGGHHGGAWKVAFADFMTAMFALFLVLWLVNQSSDVKSAIAGYFQDPLGRADEFGSSIMPGEGAQSPSVRPLTPPEVVNLRRDRLAFVAAQLEERLEGVPELADVKSFVEITMADDGLRIELLENATGVFFETGVATPSAEGRRLLEVLGAELAALPNELRIEGHTDARPYSGRGGYTNWELSADRANMARRILGEAGVPSDHIAQIRGYADRALRLPDQPLADANRRISITVLLGPTGAPGDSTNAPTATVAARGAP